MRQVNDPVWKLDSGNSSGGVLQRNSGNSVYSWLTILSGHKAGISKLSRIRNSKMNDSNAAVTVMTPPPSTLLSHGMTDSVSHKYAGDTTKVVSRRH